MSRPRLRTICFTLVLIIAGTVAGLVLAECAVRFIRPQPVYLTEAPAIFFVRHDPLLGWANREGAEGVYAPNPVIPRTSVRINGQGYRGAPVGQARTDKRRVLFLGDSNTFGYGVEEDQRFSDRVVQGSAGGMEQVNLGVFGFGTDQEALLLESRGMAWKPDVVVLGISAGDLSDTMSSVNGGAAKPFFRFFGDRLKVQNTPVPQRSPYLTSKAAASLLKRSAYEHSHLYRFILSRSMAANLYMADSVMEMKEGEGLKVMTTLISGMRDMCRENGVRFVALLIPHGVWLEGLKQNPAAPMPGYFPVLKRHLETDGIEVIDSSDRLLGALGRGEEVFFSRDPVHLTARGNAHVAESLLQRLSMTAPVR